MAIFDEELDALREKFQRLGETVERTVRDSVKSLLERDSNLAEKVIEEDHKINALDLEIDEECIRLIALRQPKAKDLRFITTVMKAAVDLERIGDLAENIAERAIELNKEPLLRPYMNIPQMAEIVQKMIRDTLDAFITESAEGLYEVIRKDDEVDALTAKNFNEMLELMIEEPRIIPIALKRTYVAKYLERIADHVTNIAEMVIYMCKGEMVRHAGIPEEVQKTFNGLAD